MTTHLEHAALDHHLHTIRRNTGHLVDHFFEHRRRECGIELDIEGFARVLDVYLERGHVYAIQNLDGKVGDK